MCLGCFIGVATPTQPSKSDWIDVRHPRVPTPNCIDSPFTSELFVRDSAMAVEDEFTCTCGLPHILATSVVPYFDEMFGDDELDQHELVNREIIEWISNATPPGGEALLFPVWQDELSEPQGTVDLTFDGLNLRELFFVERFLYRFKRELE